MSTCFLIHSDTDVWNLFPLFQSILMSFFNLLSPSTVQSFLHLQLSPAGLSFSLSESLWYSSTECITFLNAVFTLLSFLTLWYHNLVFKSFHLCWVLDSAACLSDGQSCSEYPSGDKRLSSVRNVLWDWSAFLPALRWDQLTSSHWNLCLCASSRFPLRLPKTSTTSSSSPRPVGLLCHRLLFKPYNDV